MTEAGYESRLVERAILPAMRSAYNCQANCPGGGACILDPIHLHELHICMDAGCLCHQRWCVAARHWREVVRNPGANAEIDIGPDS